MASLFSHIATVSVTSGNNNPVTTVTQTSSLAVQKGDLLVSVGGWINGTHAPVSAMPTITITKDSGSPSNDFVFDFEDFANGDTADIQSFGGYRLVADEDATATFMLTTSTSNGWMDFAVMQFRPATGLIALKDKGIVFNGISPGAITSGVLKTSRVGGLAIWGTYTDTFLDVGQITVEKINGVAITIPANGFWDAAEVGYTLPESTFNADATGNITVNGGGGGNNWGLHLMTFGAQRGFPVTLTRPRPFAPGLAR